MTNEELLKQYIVECYGSINVFAMQNDIPPSSISNIFQRGIGGSSIQLVIKICDALGISIDKLVQGKIEKKKMSVSQITDFDLELLTAFREHPEFQDAICKLLDVHFKLPKELANTNEDKAD